jgi:O-antigen/teichoic acid export membrane protein
MRRRGLRQNSVLALAGDSASKASAFVVILMAARFLSVPEFAALATGLAAAGVLGSVLDLGSGTLLARDGATSRTSRGALFHDLVRARAPLAVALLVSAPLVALAFTWPPLAALTVAALAISGALSLSVLGVYRSCQDIRPEAMQRLAAAALSMTAAGAILLLAPRADLMLAALASATLVTLVPLVRRMPEVADLAGRTRSFTALRLAAPIGLLALATVAYYRSGTLVLAGVAGPDETASFGVAASIAFGMLMIPNAVTTALLPRLAAERGLQDRVACARRALAWTFAIGVFLAVSAALVVPLGLPLVLGSTYADAGAPFALLCLGIPFIAASGVIGTSLLSVGRLRPLGLQVTVSLLVNLVVLALLVPRFGAVGAALGTVACELVGFVVLAHVARSALPGLVRLDLRRTRRRPRTSHEATA